MANAKLGVDIGQFKSGIDQAKASLKTLNAEMKANEAQFKATGNSEQYLTQKSKTLNSQMTQQKAIIDQATAALKKMADAGVDPADAAYQQLNVQLLNAQAGMYEAQTALNALDGSQQQAASSAEQLTQGMNGISKKISLDQVISGIDKITSGLENAARKAVDLGKELWDTIMDSARRADDTATMAQMYDIPLQRYKQMLALEAGGLDTTVENMLAGMDKMKNGIGKGTAEVMDSLKELGLVVTQYGGKTNAGFDRLVTDDTLDMFFRAGQAIMAMTDAYDKEATARALFGKSWKELKPLFDEYKTADEYNKALEGIDVSSEEATRNLAELNDAVGKLEGTWTNLKDEMLGAIAPALTKAADSVSDLLDRVTEYLKTDQGQEFLKSMGDAVGTLFDDLTKIDPKSVVQNFTSVFNTLKEGLQWIVDNKQGVIDALKAIVIGWGGLKLTGGALQIIKLIDGLKGLGIGGGAAASGASATGGASWFTTLMGETSSRAAGLQLAAGNGVPVMDWFMNTTAPGRQLSNWLAEITGGTPQFGQEDWLGDIGKNISDWWEQTKGLYQNAINFWGGFWAGGTTPTANPNSLPADLNWTPSYMRDQKPQVEVEPVAPENAAEDITKQVGEVTIPVTLLAQGLQMPGGGGGGGYNILMKKANGIPYVPYDGYLAMLHQGERVVPARENLSRNFSSNLYIESMYMNSGMDADGLAAAIAARNQRIMAGFGS